MEKIGSRIEYRTVPEGGETIIGSSSKDTAGELFTTTTRFQITSPTARRNKRLLDLALAFCFLFFAVPLLFLVNNPGGFLQNLFQVILGKKTWVGYSGWKLGTAKMSLPKIKPGVLSTNYVIPNRQFGEATAHWLDFFYAKDYELRRDLEIIRRAWRELGQQQN